MKDEPLILYAGNYTGEYNGRLHFHDGLELVLVLQGRCVNRTPLGEFKAAVGDLMVIPPGVRHRQCDLEYVETSFIVLETGGEWGRRGIQVLNLQEDGVGREWFDQILRLYRMRQLDECNGLLNVLLRHLNRWKDQVNRDENFPEHFLPVVMNMADHPEDQTPLADLARRHAYSVSYFNALFHRYCGVSPRVFRERVRMANARKLLLNTHGSVAEIGMNCGYATTHHFCRIFRRVHGVTPGEYRKQRNVGWASIAADSPAERLTAWTAQIPIRRS